VAVLSALPAGELAQAIARKELGKLTSISGIGKKTAERLLLELRDKLPMDEGATGAAASVPKLGVAPEGNAELLASALTRLGYKAQEAERAVQSLKDKLDGTPITDLVKEALALLAKR
jgi:Holliday junction DNA helicase RuvA